MKRKISLYLFGIIIFSVLSFSVVSVADAAVKVRGYYRSSGTYVQPHYRSNPDSRRYNNYSSYGNINPYTGSRGTRRY